MTDTKTTTGASGALPAPPPPSPADILRAIKLAAITAELLKPVATATENLFSPDPARLRAREAAAAAYAKAAGKTPPGKLRAAYVAADADFRRTAADMEGRLDAWLTAWMDDGKPLRLLLLERKKAATDVANAAPSGPLEAARDGAVAKTRLWAAAYADWSAPETRIDLKYAADIPKINADINNDIEQAYSIYRLWFDTAPKHLQLREDSVTEANAPGLSKILAKLGTDFPELAERLKSGKDRGDGSLYLIDPAGLEQRRKDVRAEWEKAAKAQATAEIDYQAAPDDLACLKKRREQLDKQYDAAVREKMSATTTD